MKKTFIAVLAVMVVLALTLGVTVACKDKTVTVTFKNGETTVSTVEVTEGAALTQEQIPAAPTAPQGKVFSGWYVGETKVEAGYKPTADVTAEAKYTDALTPNDITGMGTQASPYVIYTAKGLATFADNVNHPEVEETANWYKAYVRLGADIDMTGVKYNPAGSRAAKIGDAEQAEVVGFQGQFDGNGHTISNLTIEQNVRSTGYFGLFGFTTSGVYIHDVNIENMTVTAISGANTSDIRAYIGAVAGYLQLSQVDSVHASLTVNMQWLPSNVAVIGGIAGVFHSGLGAIAYAENVSADLNVKISEFDTGSDVSVIETAYVGGIFGMTMAESDSAAAIVNAAATGTFEGGKYLGGIVGYVGSDSQSFINCYANTTLKPTATDSRYAGGIAGAVFFDNTILDSYAKTTVVAKAQDSYVGGIVGAASEDDYEEYLTYGLAAVNCYYDLTATGITADNSYGTSRSAAFDKQFATDTLKWAAQSWDITDEKVVPTSTLARDISNAAFAVTLNDGDSHKTVNYGSNKEYDIIGLLDDADNADSNIFWNWQFADGVDYRYYVPVVKDMTLTAKRHDVTPVVGTYDGNSEYVGGTKHVGIIYLHEDGTFEYVLSITGISEWGYYCYDGEHFIAATDSADFCGTLAANADEKLTISYIWTEGSYEVTYTFVKTDEIVEPLGEFYSADGDIITFAGTNEVSLLIDDISAQSHSAVVVHFTKEGDVLTLQDVDDYYSHATITINEQGFLTDFTSSADGISDNKKQYTKNTENNYADFILLGKNNSLYMSNEYQEERSITFNNNGTMLYGETAGRYYIFGNKVKMIVDGYLSTFTIDNELGILYGYMERGWTARSQTVVSSEKDGELNGFILDEDKNNVVFATDRSAYHLKNGQLQDETITGNFEHGQIVKINEIEYMVMMGAYGNFAANSLIPVGAEHGEYTIDSGKITLDGVDKVTGAFVGNYAVCDNYVILYNISQNKLVVFDYTAAQAAEYVITPLEGDGYQGIWYNDDSDGTRGYVLVLDGFNHTQMFYFAEDSYYKAVWNGDRDWSTYTINGDGTVSATYNSYQKPTFTFYYDKKLVSAQSDNSTLNGRIFYSAGYEGEKVAPTFDPEFAGKYKGDGVSLEIKSDLSGTLDGTAFTARVEAPNVIKFTVNGTVYTFDANTLTLTHDTTSVTLTVDEGDEEPFVLEGTWNGVLNTENVYFQGKPIVLTFDGSGNVSMTVNELSYTGKYTFENNEITTSGWSDPGYVVDEITITIVNGELSVSLTLSQDDYPMPEFTATLTKQGGGEEEPSSPVVGSWTGTLEGIQVLKGQPVEIVFDATSVTITLNGLITFKGSYTYSETDGIKCGDDFTEGAFTLESLSLKLENGELSLTISIDDGEGPYNYTSTLTK